MFDRLVACCHPLKLHGAGTTGLVLYLAPSPSHTSNHRRGRETSVEERWANEIIPRDCTCVTSFDMAPDISMASSSGMAANIDIAHNVGYTMRRDGQPGSESHGSPTPVCDNFTFRINHTFFPLFQPFTCERCIFQHLQLHPKGLSSSDNVLFNISRSQETSSGTGIRGHRNGTLHKMSQRIARIRQRETEMHRRATISQVVRIGLRPRCCAARGRECGGVLFPLQDLPGMIDFE